ncbi:MAG TPA: cyclopropane-fatty-acyl-phospholipid synthase family protein [Solimonas sp.]
MSQVLDQTESATHSGDRPASTSLGLRVLMYMLKGMRIGSLDVTLPNGGVHQFRGAQEGPHGVLYLRSSAVIGRVLRGGEVGFGEAYLEGDWDSPDLTRLLEVLYLNEPYYKGPYEKNLIGRFYGWIQHKLRANTKRGSRENIEYHYDLGNEFYKLWLDDTMAYSSAVFAAREESSGAAAGTPAEANETLKDAQLNKFRLMYERLDLKPEHHLLEIGSGWGGFAIYAAQRSGCRVTSITLSKEQLAEAQRRADAEGLSARIQFEIRDYRDIQAQYDRVVSIEMYEAVGEEYWPGYFAAIEKALKPGGRAAIQGITISPKIFDEYRRKRDFIQKYIFPGGMLCTPGRFQDLAFEAGMTAEDARFYARDYADTLAHWHRNVLAVREQVVQQFDERFLRMWRYYLSYCECGFRTGSIDLMQVTLRKAG